MVTRRGFLLLGSAALLVGCGESALPTPEVPEVEAPLPRDTHVRAAKLVNAKLRALLEVSRVKDHPLAPKIVKMDAWAGIFEAANIDPLTDVDRAFVAAADARDQKNVIAVAEHHVGEERLGPAIDKLVIESGPDGEHLVGLGVPAARVLVRGKKTVILRVTPTLLVVTSEGYAKLAAGLARTGGLPEPTGPEAVTASAEHPSDTLKVRGAPRVPKTIRKVDATVTFADDGGADLVVVGKSSTTEQAKEDAKKLTRAIEDKTSIRLGPIKIGVEPIRFKPEGDEIRGKRHLTRSELGTLLDIAERSARG